MDDVRSQTVPDQQWTPVTSCTGLWVYQHTGQPQSLLVRPDGEITSAAGPIWDIRIAPQIGRIGADGPRTTTQHHAQDPTTVADARKKALEE